MSDVFVAGLGAICSIGNDVDASFAAAAAGADGLSRLSLFDAGLKDAPWVGQVNADLEALLGCAAANRTLSLSLIAARQCFAGIADRGGLRTGMVFATTVGGISRSEVFYRELLRDPGRIEHAAEELAFHEPTALAGEVARRCSLDGFLTVSTACSSGLHAVGMAARLVESGEYDLCLALGADALCLLTVRGFASLMLLDSQGCRPFDRNRAGISLGEGAGGLLLASPQAAARLKTPRLARVSGWGASADAHHMTAPHPEGAGARQAIEAALAEAGLRPDAVDFVIAHGTGTPDNDLAETAALKSVFATPPPFCSLKRCLGHTLAASGSLEAVFAVKALQTGTLLPSGGFAEADEKIGATPVLRAERRPLTHVLKNAFGFGGNNGAVVFSSAA